MKNHKTNNKPQINLFVYEKITTNPFTFERKFKKSFLFCQLSQS